VIVEPINDVECLGQLTKIARELAPTTLIRSVAQKLGEREAVIRWFQSLPQSDDIGEEVIRSIQCDVPQRVRLLPDDPNCVERSTGALMLLETLEPNTPRALATVDQPLRHTGLVEKYGAHWRAVDLFPRRNARRNFDFAEFGKDLLQGVHNYVGKPILGFYGLGGVADTIGDYENKLIGRDKKQPEKKSQPPPAGGQPRSQPRPQPAQSSGSASALVGAVGSLLGSATSSAGARSQPTPADRGGGKDAEKETQQLPASTARVFVDGAGSSRGQTAQGDGGRPYDEDAGTRRLWWWPGS
jgi:hypothetical protein